MVVPLDTVTAAMKLKKNGSMEAETGLPPLLVTSWKFEVPAVPVKLRWNVTVGKEASVPLSAFAAAKMP